MYYFLKITIIKYIFLGIIVSNLFAQDEETAQLKTSSSSAGYTQVINNNTISQPSNDPSDKFPLLLSCAKIATTRSLVSFLFEHPVDVIVTSMQAFNSTPTVLQTVRNLSKEGGFSAFYRGGIPKLFSLQSRNIYQWWLFGTLPSACDGILPKDIPFRGYAGSILTGFMMACSDTFFIAPFERIKVLRIINAQRDINFYKEVRADPIRASRELLHGTSALYQGLAFSWASFFMINHFLEEKRNQNIDRKLSSFSLVSASIGMGCLDVLIYLPFQMVKTQFQKDPPTSKKYVYQEMMSIFRERGFAGVYTGWKISVPRAIIYSLFDFYYLSSLIK